MRFSQKTNYALWAMLDLAVAAPHDSKSIAAIGADRHIPEQFLQVIMRELRQGGFVDSRRGKLGGYRLSRPAREIKVGELVRFLEGGFFSVDDDHTPSAYGDLWVAVQKACDGVLDATSLADLADRERLHATGAADFVI